MDEVIEAGSGEDLQYLQRRAEEELEAAQRSTVPEVTAAHYELAEAYRERIEAKGAAPASGGGADEPADSRRGGPVAERAREAGRPCKGWSGR